MKMILLVLLVLGCEPSDDTADRVLEAEGLHNITYNGHAFFACSDGDGFSENCVAYRTVLDTHGTPHEQRVEGVLCCGILKACTVRY